VVFFFVFLKGVNCGYKYELIQINFKSSHTTLSKKIVTYYCTSFFLNTHLH